MIGNLLIKVGVLALSMQISGCTRPVVSFSSDVQPILEKHCIECHDSSGEGVVTSGFSVLDYDSVLKGTKFGQVIVPGSSISSTLYLVVAHKTATEIQMPPHHILAWADGRGSPLSDDEIEIIQTWIEQGAQDN
jgi:hypothetical protein